MVLAAAARISAVTLRSLPPTAAASSSAGVNPATPCQSILTPSFPAPCRPSGPIYQLLDNETLTARNQETAPFYNSVKAELTPITADKAAVQFKVFKLLNLISINAPATAKGVCRGGASAAAAGVAAGGCIASSRLQLSLS